MMANLAAAMNASIYLRLVSVCLWITPCCAFAQYPGWQQAIDYTMDITVDAPLHQYTGSMDVTYTNNSPDALDRIPFHLFFNAFQRFRCHMPVATP